jgi:hypothetical protein
LLEKLKMRTLEREEAEELRPLVERTWYDVVKQGNDPDFASEISQMLIVLDGYIHRRIELVEYVPISDKLVAETRRA